MRSLSAPLAGSSLEPRAEAGGNSCERSDIRFGMVQHEAPAIVPIVVTPRPVTRRHPSGSFAGSAGRHFSLSLSYHLECLYFGAQSPPRHVFICSGLTN